LLFYCDELQFIPLIQGDLILEGIIFDESF